MEIRDFFHEFSSKRMHGLEFIACKGGQLEQEALTSFVLFDACCSIAAHAQKWTSS